MGWTVAVGMVTSLPFLIFSGPITDMIGHMNVIALGMLAYFIRSVICIILFVKSICSKIFLQKFIKLNMRDPSFRMLGYSLVTNPVYIYPFEALEGLTMALMMTSAVTYVASISTPNTIASVMGIMGALFFGVGKGAGSLFGGLIMSYYDVSSIFKLIGTCNNISGFLQLSCIKI